MTLRTLTAVFVLLGLGLILESRGDSADTGNPPCAECDRQARKVFEALQAWRRTHEGRYPASLGEMVRGQLVAPMSIFCPLELKEMPSASSAHPLAQSRGEGLDPSHAYNYELSPDLKEMLSDYMGEPISNRAIKEELLRRPFWEQVAILRCSAHSNLKPRVVDHSGNAFRNLTASGNCYWSGPFWEREWSQIALTCRQALVTQGLRGPPFAHEIGPSMNGQLDLRALYNACGERAWWWGLRFIDSLQGKTIAPDLSSLMKQGIPQSHLLKGQAFWLDGVVQLQGKIFPNAPGEEAFRVEMFPWRTAPIPVGRQIDEAKVLTGCIWPEEEGTKVADLIWKYSDGTERRTSMLYGDSVRRFWDTGNDRGRLPEPVFQSPDGENPKVRVYSVACKNPEAGRKVESLVIESNAESRAAPFVLAITVGP